jgi:hypothetical protein
MVSRGGWGLRVAISTQSSDSIQQLAAVPQRCDAKKQGLSDVLVALQASPWLAPMPEELGVRVFDVMHDILTRRSEPV